MLAQRGGDLEVASKEEEMIRGAWDREASRCIGLFAGFAKKSSLV